MARRMNWVVFNEALLPERRLPWKSFGAGFGLQCLAIAILVIIPMLVPEKLHAVKRYWITPVEAPPIVPWKPQPTEAVKPTPVKHEIVKTFSKPEEITPPKPKIYSPVISAPIAKSAKPRKNTPTPDLAEVAKAYPSPAPSMSVGSSAIPTLRKPREEVQTGGFGDPNGVHDNGNRNRAPNTAQLGSYDLPSGPGYGNGTSGAKGARGVVASSGFGNGVATGDTRGSRNRGTVQQGVFAEVQPVAETPKVTHVALVSNTAPVEILFKPRPAYTDEARTKKIEGEVVLRVAFSASGDVRVLQVVRGLGYGLDQSGEEAAREIRFRPAQANGQPVDSIAFVHITFQLAY